MPRVSDTHTGLSPQANSTRASRRPSLHPQAPLPRELGATPWLDSTGPSPSRRASAVPASALPPAALDAPSRRTSSVTDGSRRGSTRRSSARRPLGRGQVAGYLLTAGADGIAKLWTVRGELVGILGSAQATALALGQTLFQQAEAPRTAAQADSSEEAERAESEGGPRATPMRVSAVRVDADRGAAALDSALAALAIDTVPSPSLQAAPASPESVALSALNVEGRCWHVASSRYLRVVLEPGAGEALRGRKISPLGVWEQKGREANRVAAERAAAEERAAEAEAQVAGALELESLEAQLGSLDMAMDEGEMVGGQPSEGSSASGDEADSPGRQGNLPHSSEQRVSLLQLQHRALQEPSSTAISAQITQILAHRSNRLAGVSNVSPAAAAGSLASPPLPPPPRAERAPGAVMHRLQVKAIVDVSAPGARTHREKHVYGGGGGGEDALISAAAGPLSGVAAKLAKLLDGGKPIEIKGKLSARQRRETMELAGRLEVGVQHIRHCRETVGSTGKSLAPSAALRARPVPTPPVLGTPRAAPFSRAQSQASGENAPPPARKLNTGRVSPAHNLNRYLSARCE
ncbi:hypothetical protein T492DRAFT_180817 [Pavlovales sp. CCMP2436]|nr:hypothetical protein T492DRAFT_180817 [Pavlovales sp. CCMP2436]